MFNTYIYVCIYFSLIKVLGYNLSESNLFFPNLIVYVPMLLNPARQVDPGPGRPGGWTDPGLLKDRLGQ